jgi:hypothetical protein
MAVRGPLPVDQKYLDNGLAGLSRAHYANPMAGHLGAAIVAGYFLGEQQPDLDSTIFTAIESQLDRILHGESAFSPGDGSGITVAEMFAPLEPESPRPDLIDSLAQALSRNMDEPRQSGHNVIFTSIAIRALKDHPEHSTPSVVNGIRDLIQGFDHATPGSGYYGPEQGRIDGAQVPLKPDPQFPPYSDLSAMVNAVLDLLILRGAENRIGYGGLIHIINHAAALCELANYGYQHLAAEGLAAHHKHVRLWLSLPGVEAEQGPQTPVKYHPRTPAYWEPGNLREGAAKLTHRIKTFYGFYTMVAGFSDPAKISQAEDGLLYLM